LSLVTEIVICCLFSVWEDFEFGSKSLITLGLARDDTIRKNSRRKNIISFRDDVATSGLKCFVLLIIISQHFYDLIYLSLHQNGISIYHHLQIMITAVGYYANN